MAWASSPPVFVCWTGGLEAHTTSTAKDVLELIALVQRTAREQRGIDVETEVQIIGEDTPF